MAQQVKDPMLSLPPQLGFDPCFRNFHMLQDGQEKKKKRERERQNRAVADVIRSFKMRSH